MKDNCLERLLYRVDEVAFSTSFGKSKTYDLVRRGVIPSVRIAGSIRVPAGALKKFLADLETASAATP